MSNKVPTGKMKDRSNERGAALVMALMITFLLLVASASLLLESSLNAQNVTDATTEQQAYNAAESGIQSAINVLRGNVPPNPLLDTSKPATDVANKIDYVKALKLASSNLAGDSSALPRMSRWVGYNGTCNDRVTMGSSGCTGPNSFSYALSVTDPDNTGGNVSYTTSGTIIDNDVALGIGPSSQKTYGNSTNGIVIRYYPTSVTDLNVIGGATATNFGYFKVTIKGTGATITSFNRFELVVRMTRPYAVRRYMRGYIETNTAPGSAPMILFDAQTYNLVGSIMVLNLPGGAPIAQLPPSQRYGYEAPMTGSSAGSDNVITGTMTAPEPTRLLLKSTGYGPRGSTKRLEAIIQKDLFAGLRFPSTLTLVGPAATIGPPATSFTFEPGSSAVLSYSGDDASSTDIIPPIGTTDPDILDDVQSSVARVPPHPFNGDVIGAPSDVSGELPDFLQSPSALDGLVRTMANIAQSSGRFYPSGTTPPDFGDNVTGQGITFCDGNCTLTGNGGGILIVTGKLTLGGAINFKGLIIVTGQNGINSLGGGGGTILGNIVVAPYVGSRIEDGITPALSDTFLAPQYDLRGGGNLTIQYDSNATANALVAVSNFVLGVVEK